MANIGSKNPEKIVENRINYKILGLIGGAAVGYQILLYYDFQDIFNVSDSLYMLAIAAVAFMGIVVSNKYRGSEIFGKAYFLLGLGFAAIFVGDSFYYYYEYALEEIPYPAPGDAAFVVGYGLITSHIILNTHYFKPKWNSIEKAWLIALPIVILSVYSIIAAEEWGEYDELPFDLFYGMIFVGGASIELAFAVLGASVFRRSILGPVWLLLAIGLFLGAFADVWYYYLEIFESHLNNHPVNTLWILGFLVMIYALHKHRKTI